MQCPVIRNMLLCSLAVALSACSSSGPVVTRSFVADGEYDSEFPTTPTSSYLERMGESIQRLNAVAYYKTYFFGPQERFRLTDVGEAVLSAHEATSVYANSTTSGTATVIVSGSRRIAFLTCAHIVAFPDTLTAYFPGADRKPSPYVATVSILKRTALYVATLPEGGTVEVLALDRANDLAIVGHRYESSQLLMPPVLPYALGKSDELRWGTFLYLYGYPAGIKVVTRGIVSSPNKDKKHSFVVDAVFGRGFSGGICLALRDGVPNFEVVGLIKMVPAHSSYVLTPGREHESDEIDLDLPYTGQIFIERRTEIEYGITQAISAETVREFLDSHMLDLSQLGYPLERSFLGTDR
ncbi:MAG TPA: serine protease [Bacteroidota bacterium]|nr:serine protease [Bacteroidota bacterium]